MCKKLGILLIIIFGLAGCTLKDNPVGYDPVNEPRKLKLMSDIISNIYSYEDTVKGYMNSTVMSLGNQGKYQSSLLLRFSNLPDSLAEIEDDIELKLVVYKQNNFHGNTIRIGLINQEWNQNYVSWKSAKDTTDWEYPFYIETDHTFEISDPCNTNDTLSIKLPIDLFYSESRELMYVDSLINNYGIILTKESADYNDTEIIEFYTSEGEDDYEPELSFSYKLSADDEEYTDWTSSTVYDGMIYISSEDDLESYEVYADSLIFRNISPTKMFLSLDVGLRDFISDPDTTGIDSEEELKRLTVNKATLVLSAKPGYYLSNEEIYALPYLMTDSIYVNTPENDNIPVYNESFVYISGSSTTQDTLTGGVFRIDITRVFQSYLVEDDGNDGLGIILMSARENRDFSMVKFYNQDEEESKRPWIELIYTPPLQP